MPQRGPQTLRPSINHPIFHDTPSGTSLPRFLFNQYSHIPLKRAALSHDMSNLTSPFLLLLVLFVFVGPRPFCLPGIVNININIKDRHDTCLTQHAGRTRTQIGRKQARASSGPVHESDNVAPIRLTSVWHCRTRASRVLKNNVERVDMILLNDVTAARGRWRRWPRLGRLGPSRCT